MVAEVFPCPQCSQLNTTHRTTCKNCGADLKQVLDSVEPLEKVEKTRFARTLDIIIVVFLGIISAVIVPPLFYNFESSTAESTAMHIGRAMSSTITNKHSEYLINKTDYTVFDVVVDTQYFDGIKATTGTSPRDGQISADSPTTISLNYKNTVFKWDYIPRKGDTPAFLEENSDSFQIYTPDK